MTVVFSSLAQHKTIKTALFDFWHGMKNVLRLNYYFCVSISNIIFFKNYLFVDC